MANTNFTVHNGLTVGPTSIDATSGNITIGGSLITTGSSGFSVTAPTGSNGYGTIYANNYAGNVSAYVIADNTFVHFGSATATQLNWKVNGQTPAYITTNGSVVVSGLTSLNTSGYGNVYVTNYAGNNTAYVVSDNSFVHIGSATNTQLNLKVNKTTPAYIDTTGNVVVVGNTTIGSGSANLFIQNSTGSSIGFITVDTGNTHIGSYTNNGVNFKTNGATKAVLDATGNFYPVGNASANIGSTTNYWNNIYAVSFLGTSTTAKYADLAERYTSDANYEPGTVVDFGGDAEVTISNINGSQFIAGVVSTNPAYMMNSDANGLYIALTGRVPTKVTGPVRKGQMMVSNGDGTARAENNPTMGSVIGKALQNFGDGVGVIEVVVGRL